MEKIVIRRLRAEEIECRVAQCGKNKNGSAWCSLLLYKDARVDQRILDEVFGITGWKRSHELIGDRLYCTVSIWDADKGEWISKQDVGTESYTEKEKGQASDAFKRACFNIGIGRELYSAPKIFINLNADEYGEKSDGNGKSCRIYPKISIGVSSISYDDFGQIVALTLTDNNGNVRYAYGTTGDKQPQPPAPIQPPAKKEINDKQFQQAIAKINSGQLDVLEKCKSQFDLKDYQLHALSEAVTSYKINNNIK